MAQSDETEELIAARAAEGDTEAFALLMARYEPRLLRYVAFMVHDSALAADIVQETFIRAYQNLKAFDTKRKFSSWLYRIAHNQTIDAIRKNRHASDVDIDQLPIISYEPSISETIDVDLLKSDVRQCLSKLPVKYAEAVQLVYLEGMSYADASDVLHIPAQTVGTRLARAKRRLKTICEQQGVTI